MRAVSSASTATAGEFGSDGSGLNCSQEQHGFQPLLMRASEVATALNLGRSTIYTLMASGALPTIRIGRAIRVPRAGLEDWVRKQTHSSQDGAES